MEDCGKAGPSVGPASGYPLESTAGMSGKAERSTGRSCCDLSVYICMEAIQAHKLYQHAFV